MLLHTESHHHHCTSNESEGKAPAGFHECHEFTSPLTSPSIQPRLMLPHHSLLSVKCTKVSGFLNLAALHQAELCWAERNVCLLRKGEGKGRKGGKFGKAVLFVQAGGRID